MLFSRAKIFKALSLALGTIYFFTHCAFAHAPEAGFWAERRSALSRRGQGPLQVAALPAAAPLPGLLSQAQAPHPSSIDSSPALIGKYADLLSALPAAFGTVRKISGPAADRLPVVIHIQDVHMNAGAQSNIAEAIKALAERGLVDAVALEGEFQPMDLAAYRAFPDGEAVRQTADYLLKENGISGPVHAAMTWRGEGFPPLLGADDRALHAANVDAYRRSAPRQAAYRTTLSAQRAELDRHKADVFNPALLDFDRQAQAHMDGKISLGEYVRALDGSSTGPQTRLFLQALGMESVLDFRQVESERARLLETLAQKLTAGRLTELLQRGLDHRLGRAGHADFYRFLQGLCQNHGVTLSDFPAMDGYVRYVLTADRISAEALFRELAALEKTRYASLAAAPREKALVAESTRLRLAAKLVEFSLTADEWGEYVDDASPPLKSLETLDLSSFESFYKHAQARDEAMAKNLQNLLSLTPKAPATRAYPVTVLVAGGYHSAGIEERLRRAGAVVVSFVPKIEKIDVENASAYLSIFSQEKTPLEKMLQGEKLFLAQNPRKEVLSDMAAALISVLAAFRAGAMARTETYFRRLATGSRLRVAGWIAGTQALVVALRRPGQLRVLIEARLSPDGRAIVETGQQVEGASWSDSRFWMRWCSWWAERAHFLVAEFLPHTIKSDPWAMALFAAAGFVLPHLFRGSWLPLFKGRWNQVRPNWRAVSSLDVLLIGSSSALLSAARSAYGWDLTLAGTLALLTLAHGINDWQKSSRPSHQPLKTVAPTTAPSTTWSWRKFINRSPMIAWALNAASLDLLIKSVVSATFAVWMRHLGGMSGIGGERLFESNAPEIFWVWPPYLGIARAEHIPLLRETLFLTAILGLFFWVVVGLYRQREPLRGLKFWAVGFNLAGLLSTLLEVAIDGSVTDWLVLPWGHVIHLADLFFWMGGFSALLFSLPLAWRLHRQRKQTGARPDTPDKAPGSLRGPYLSRRQVVAGLLAGGGMAWLGWLFIKKRPTPEALFRDFMDGLIAEWTRSADPGQQRWAAVLPESLSRVKVSAAGASEIIEVSLSPGNFMNTDPTYPAFSWTLGAEAVNLLHILHDQDVGEAVKADVRVVLQGVIHKEMADVEWLRENPWFPRSQELVRVWINEYLRHLADKDGGTSVPGRQELEALFKDLRFRRLVKIWAAQWCRVETVGYLEMGRYLGHENLQALQRLSQFPAIAQTISPSLMSLAEIFKGSDPSRPNFSWELAMRQVGTANAEPGSEQAEAFQFATQLEFLERSEGFERPEPRTVTDFMRYVVDPAYYSLTPDQLINEFGPSADAPPPPGGRGTPPTANIGLAGFVRGRSGSSHGERSLARELASAEDVLSRGGRVENARALRARVAALAADLLGRPGPLTDQFTVNYVKARPPMPHPDLRAGLWERVWRDTVPAADGEGLSAVEAALARAFEERAAVLMVLDDYRQDYLEEIIALALAKSRETGRPVFWAAETPALAERAGRALGAAVPTLRPEVDFRRGSGAAVLYADGLEELTRPQWEGRAESLGIFLGEEWSLAPGGRTDLFKNAQIFFIDAALRVHRLVEDAHRLALFLARMA